jgi:hypothetical protein
MSHTVPDQDLFHFHQHEARWTDSKHQFEKDVLGATRSTAENDLLSESSSLSELQSHSSPTQKRFELSPFLKDSQRSNAIELEAPLVKMSSNEG